MSKIRTSKFQILVLIISSFGVLLSGASTILPFVPSLSKETDSMFYPVLSNLTPMQYGIIAFVSFAVTFGVFYFGYIRTLKSEISKYPFIKLAGVGIENVFPNTNLYGANSLIARSLNPNRKLFYLDLINNPIKNGNNDAINVSVELAYFQEGEFSPHRKHLARWIGTPEKELGEPHISCNIPSDGKTKVRWGMGYVDNEYGDNFFLLDAEQTDLSSHGLMLNPPFLPEGKYTVVANIFGNNLREIDPFVFEISTVRDKPVNLYIKKDTKKWLKLVEKESKRISKLWSSLA